MIEVKKSSKKVKGKEKAEKKRRQKRGETGQKNALLANQVPSEAVTRREKEREPKKMKNGKQILRKVRKK